MSDKAISIGISEAELASVDKLVSKFRAVGTSAKLSKKELDLLEKSLIDIVKQMSNVKVTSPFSSLVADTKNAKEALTLLNADLKKTSTLMLKGLTLKKNAGFRTLLTDAKAVLTVQQQINAEVEKQAALKARLLTLKGTSDSAKALAAAKAETAVLEKKTNSIDRQAAALTKLQTRLKAMKGTAALPTASFNEFRNTLAKTTTELLKTGASQQAVIAGISKQVTAWEKLNAAEKKAADALKKTNAELAKQKTQLEKSRAAATKFGTSMKYAVGGVARSMGAMTYSYSMLAPLIAGMAVGGAIKKLYELGAAFEYTTTYVEALGDGLNSLSASDIQGGILDLEGLRKGPEELAMGMKEFAKAGVDAADSLRQIGEMSKFATIAELDLGAASKLVIGQSNAFGIEFTEAANMISVAALSSATDIEELGSALSYTTELATVSGASFDEVATAMAIMANAGIRGCYDRKTDVLTKDGWKKWEDVTYDDSFATYNADSGELEYQEPERLIRYKHTGQMYRIANKGVDLCVTPEHRMFVKRRDHEDFEILTAEEVAGKSVRYKTGGLGWVGESPEKVTLPGFTQDRGSWDKEVPPVDIDAEDWATFLGWYIAEGHCNKNKGSYRVVITQKKKKHLKKMRMLFDRFPWACDYTASTGQFRFTSEQLFRVLKPLGQVYAKHIPQYAKNWGTELLTLLYTALMEGDGDKEGRYYTSSVQLRDDFQEICLKLGYATLYRQTTSEGDTSAFTGGRQTIARADGWRISVTTKRTEPWNDPYTRVGAHGERLVEDSAYDLYEGWVDYDDEVFCAEVPNGLLIVRRNGRAVVSGNSKAGTAIRTSVLKMQAPTSTFKKTMNELGISWDAFTEEGKIKNLRTMFTELKRVTDVLPDAQRVKVMKELFGLRALKGGANVLRAMGDEWDNLNTKIRESTEGVSFIDSTYEKLGDTVTAKLETLGATFEKSLLKAYESADIKDILDSLTDTVASEGFVDTLSSVVQSINAIAGGIISIAGVLKGLPGGVAEFGLVGYVLFGTSVPGRIAAAALAVSKLTSELGAAAAAATELEKAGVFDKRLKDNGDLAGSSTNYVSDQFDEMERAKMLARKSVEQVQYGGADIIPTGWVRSAQEITDALNEMSAAAQNAEAVGAEMIFGNYKYKPKKETFAKTAFTEGMSQAEADLARLKFALEQAFDTSAGMTQVTNLMDRIAELGTASDASARALTDMLDPISGNTAWDVIDLPPELLSQTQSVLEELYKVDYAQQLDQMTAWEKRLQGIQAEVAGIVAAAAADKDNPFTYTDEQMEKLLKSKEAALDATAAREFASVLDKLKFNNVIAGLNNSGVAADKFEAKVLKLKETLFKELAKTGDAIKKEGAIEFPTPRGQEAFALALDTLTKGIDKYKEAIDAIDYEAQKMGLTDWESKLIDINKAADDLSDKQEEAGKGALTAAQRAEYVAKATALAMKQNISDVSAYQKIIDDINYDRQNIGLNDWEIKLKDIKKAADELAASEGFTAAQKAQYITTETASAMEKNIYDIVEATKDLDFQTTIDGLKESDSAIDNLKGSYKELERSINKDLLSKGLLDSAEGDAFFAAALRNANLLSPVIKGMREDLKSTKMEMKDMEFSLGLEGMDDAGKNRALKTRVEELKKLSKQAGEAGLEGRKKEIEYLKQARALILEMNTDQKAVTRGQAQKAYDAYAARYKAVRGGVQKNDPELLRLAAESRRLTKLYQDKEADPRAVKKANDEKLRLLKEVNKAQLEAQKKQIGGMESMKQSVLDAGTNFMANAKTAGEIFKGVVESTILPGAGTPSAGVVKGVQDSASTAFTDQSAVFNTALSDEEAAKFEVWLTDISNSLGRDLARDLADYDLQGYWKEEVSNGVREGIKEGAHFPDTFKKPGHPTFSAESKYSVDGRSGGKWGEGSFAPSKDQLAAGWDTTKMKEYFSTAEEGIKVLKGGIIGVTQEQSGGEMTNSGLVINLKDTTEAAKEAKAAMNRLYDSPVSGDTFEEFIAGLKKTREEAKRASDETKRVKLLEINPEEVKKASGVMKAEAKELQEAFLKSGKVIAEVRAGIVDKTNSMTGLTPEQTAEAEKELAQLKEILAQAEKIHNQDAAALSGFIDLLKNSKKGTEAMSDGFKQAEEDIKEVNKYLEKTNDLITNMPKLNVGSSSGSIEKRAVGGPVSAGESYLVGEVGAELFTPNTSGYITPNDKLRGKNSSTVDINLTLNGSEPIQLQGTQTNVDQLIRAFEDKERYAA